MSRTVVGVVGRERTFVMLDQAAADVVMDDLSEVNLAALAADGTLAQRGDALLQVLNTDAAIQKVLAALLTNGLNSPPAPLYFHVRAAAADAVIWEQLHANERFVALDRRWPIGRIARQALTVELRTFQPPLRIVAVLSAAGRSGLSQLQALSDARTGVDLPTSLHVISGDEELRPAAIDRGATFELIGATGTQLMSQVQAARPHVLHMLCHGGGTAAGVRRLALANAADVDAAHLDPAVLGSVLISVPQLGQTLAPCNPWLVVLGACESAAAEGGGTAGESGAAGQSLAVAHELACSGVPGVIGMRRLIDISATDTFCREFYPEALDLVRRTVTAADGQARTADHEIDWVQALTRPRLALSMQDPETVDVWTDPVLYAQQGALRVSIASGQVSPDEHAAGAGKLDQLQRGLAALIAADAAPEVIAEVAARIAELRAEL